MVDGDVIVSADGVTLAEPTQLIARVALVGPGNPLPMRVRHAGASAT